ncbi:hypothetical protein WDA55_20375, partial [Acinetobacter baumannii]
PTSYNEFSQKGFEEFVEHISEFIEDYFPDLKEEMEIEMYIAAKDGGITQLLISPVKNVEKNMYVLMTI